MVSDEASGPAARACAVREGMFAFNVLTSIGYGSVAIARAGPFERDTRGIADSARVDERAVGALVMAPAILDLYQVLEAGLAVGGVDVAGGEDRERVVGPEVARTLRSAGAGLKACVTFSHGRTERERHRALDDDLAVDARDALRAGPSGCAAA